MGCERLVWVFVVIFRPPVGATDPVLQCRLHRIATKVKGAVVSPPPVEMLCIVQLGASHALQVIGVHSSRLRCSRSTQASQTWPVQAGRSQAQRNTVRSVVATPVPDRP